MNKLPNNSQTAILEVMYDRHEVSIKVALYSSDGKRTLLMRHWGDAGFGLPGGHIDAGEMPDEALERELREELGMTIDATPAGFYVRDPYDTTAKNHKIILGYTATVDDDIELPGQACDGSEAGPVWLTRAEVETTDKLAPGYRDFVLKWWP